MSLELCIPYLISNLRDLLSIGDPFILPAHDPPKANRTAQGEENPGHVLHGHSPHHRQLAAAPELRVGQIIDYDY